MALNQLDMYPNIHLKYKNVIETINSIHTRLLECMALLDKCLQKSGYKSPDARSSWTGIKNQRNTGEVRYIQEGRVIDN